MKRLLTLWTLIVLSAAAADAQDAVPVASFAERTHVHGLAVDPSEPGALFIATHHGLYRAAPDGMASLVSIVQDFMGFTVSPEGPGTMFASGHPASGGNLGFIVSDDGGQTWVQRSPGLNGPVDFHMLTVTRADTAVLYGVFRAMQRSTDAGATWSRAGDVPAQTIDIAGSAVDPDTVFAAGGQGLFVSADAGATWSPLVEGMPVSLVEIGPGGEVYAYALGAGLLVATNEGGPFQSVGSDLGERYLVHLAPDPLIEGRLYAADQSSEVLVSDDRGTTWRPFGG